MVKSDFLHTITNPLTVTSQQAKEIKLVIDAHPYFQAARAVYLKYLQQQASFKYNNELKATAAYTTDRSVLFNFITNNDFSKVSTSNEKENSVADNNEIIVSEEEKASIDLEIGKPIPFTKSETHSFNQWLQLATTASPIIRSENEEKPEEKSEKDKIIERFIASNPKIAPVSKTAPLKPLETSAKPQLMTETLAKVYLEQKKYDSAVKAYEILSLKYPEKSSFFADQIKRIQILQNIK
ncbi:hypothetical protein [Tenacibaculum geojense]|uniref:Tetratricopeptide repeat protein n=1 Tax=Tenacibaculum geojense TaxID=915352 RepID=A0ABW3JU27_9FLAO